MDQTTSLGVDAGSFQTSYADDVVTASNGPACTSASANPACAAATAAWAFTTSARPEAPASACALDCASTGGAAGAAPLLLSVRRRPMEAGSPLNEVPTWFLAAIRSTWAAARAACACSTSALAAMPARTCASACRTCASACATAAWRVATTACARRTEKYACAAVSAALWRAWASEASADDTAASACLIWYRAWRLSSSSDADTLTLLLVAVGTTVVVSEEFP